MSVDSRSRSRSPMSNDDRRRHDKRKYERNRVPSKRSSSDCRVYVSNIPYEFKWQDLKDLFRSEVGAVAYVEMFNDNNGRPRGSAVVDFETPEMARKATDKMHRYELKGRKLVVKERDEIVNSREFMFLFNKDMDNRDRNRFGRETDRRRPYERPSFPDPVSQPVNYGNTYGLSISFLESLGINGPLVNKVFVANLDYKLAEDDLRELFKVAGKVTNTEIIKDQDGKSRGFGVVEFEHPVQAVQAISMLHNQTYYDRKINVRLDRVAEKQQKEGPASKLPPGLRGLGMGLGLNGEPITDVSNLASTTPINSSMGNVPNMNPGMGLGGFDIGPANNMASNVRPNMNPTMSMMGMTGMDPINNSMGGNTMGMGMGMPTGMGATGGIGSPNMMGGLSGMNPGSMGSVPGANSFVSQGGGSGGMGAATSGNSLYGNGFNNSAPSSDYNSNFGSMRNVVQISNLPVDYTWQNLKDLCRNYGDIRFAEIRSKGLGLVRFATDTEARRTADMLDRQRFDGRVLDARVM